MVGIRGQCNTYYPSAPFWKNFEHEHAGTFFSVDYAGRGELFEGLSIWQEEKYRELQGTYPVISLSFARVKEANYADARARMCEILQKLYVKFSYIKDSPVMTETDRAYFDRMLASEISHIDATSSLYHLSDFLYRYYDRKVIILLDEYDTPMQEAYVNDYWNELVVFTRSLFNSTFKTNPWSILNFIDKQNYTAYWANTSGNNLAGKLLREANPEVKKQFEILIQGGTAAKGIPAERIRSYGLVFEGKTVLVGDCFESGAL